MPLKCVNVNPDAAVASMNHPSGESASANATADESASAKATADESDSDPTRSAAANVSASAIGERIFMLWFRRFPV